jgi:predicted nucleic acid-binding protein
VVSGAESTPAAQAGMPRFVAADASPLIGLAAAGVFEVLRELFGTVTITRLVKDEVAGRGDLPGAKDLDAAMRGGWIRVAPAPLDTWRFAELDSGEASTIALAAQHEGALVLMDDARGRAQAAALGLEVMDVPGVLLAAKTARLVAAVQPLVARLARRGFTIADAARRALLDSAGEPDTASIPDREP